jgi:hypothetical protein
MKKIFTVLYLTFFITCYLNAQVAVNTDGSNAHESALLDVKSSEKGVLIPRLTDAEIVNVNNPAIGLLVFNSDKNDFYYYNGTNWIPVGLAVSKFIDGTNTDDAVYMQGNVGIGTNDPDAKLEVSGLIKITGGSPGENKVLTSDQDGLASWKEIVKDNFGNLYGTVLNEKTGKIWLDRNLGASRVAISSDDSEGYGYLFQWGRADDGHQYRNSGTYTGPVDHWIASDGLTSWDNLFVTVSGSDPDWQLIKNNDLWTNRYSANNPCPCGFRIPTNAEWLQEMRSWDSKDVAGAFASPLKLTTGGVRDNTGSFLTTDSWGWYWSSTVDSFTGQEASGNILIYETGAGMQNNFKAYGMSIRCIKD